METQRYVIRGGLEGRERLRLLSEVMGSSTRTLLREIGIPVGSKCLDVGCGAGDVTFELARLSGPTGQAIGVDLDETKLELARQDKEQWHLSNIRFEKQDLTEWEPNELFDIVYARFLLTHLSEPAALLSVLCQHLSPGGVIIIEDIDFRGHFAEPDCPALSQFVKFYTTLVQTRGADPNIGPRVPGLLREIGLDQVQMKLVHPVAFEGGIKLLTYVTLENIADTVLEDGLTTEEELRQIMEELYTFTQNPHTLLGGPPIFQAWGRNQTPLS